MSNTETTNNGASKMINYENKGKVAQHKTTKTCGVVVCEYNKTTNGKEMVEVQIRPGYTAHWPAKKVLI